MTNVFKNLFGRQEDLKTIYRNGAVILDVRTPREFQQGHIEGAINIPLDRLAASLDELKKMGAPVITCCLSGARSGSAMTLLANAGLDVYNGGPWPLLEKTIR